MIDKHHVAVYTVNTDISIYEQSAEAMSAEQQIFAQNTHLRKIRKQSDRIQYLS